MQSINHYNAKTSDLNQAVQNYAVNVKYNIQNKKTQTKPPVIIIQLIVSSRLSELKWVQLPKLGTLDCSYAALDCVSNPKIVSSRSLIPTPRLLGC
ncbi:hypothetical protein MJO29_006361 [Puccinia striiformis f. sp. tritici]|nr:hypothetical protein MJO29_006361 [Puccinia striiformis f. sp. tritici]